MKEAFCIKSEIKEEMKECFSDCKFQDSCKNEIEVTDTPDYVKCENIDIKYEPLETVRLSSTENETLPAACNGTRNEVAELNILKYENSDLVDGQATASNFQMKYEDDGEEEGNLSCSKTPTYRCSVCQYNTRWKSNLQIHMAVHTDPSKAAKYECNTCGFKTKWRSNLQKHVLLHAEFSKTAKYECDTCGFKTRWKLSLKKHKLLHAEFSETAMYECSTCSFKTRWKESLQTHMLVHTDPSKTATYECRNCSYKTRRKGDLRRHTMLVHTNPKRK